jgi:hypothetical protein
MQGDKLASGAERAQFHGPKISVDEARQREDLRSMSEADFKFKYLITNLEYKMLLESDGEKTNMLMKQMQEQTEVIERLTALDKAEDQALRKQCFIEPFLSPGAIGRVIVTRDIPTVSAETSKLALPKHLRKEKTRLPTTGHIIRAQILNAAGDHIGHNFIGLRILFGPMSGTAICFEGYPTWIMLDVNEIMGIVHKEDAVPIEEPIEPLT